MSKQTWEAWHGIDEYGVDETTPQQPVGEVDGKGMATSEHTNNFDGSAATPDIETMLLAATVRAIAKDPHSFGDSAIVGVDEQLASRGFEPVFTRFPAIQYAGTETTAIVSRPLVPHPIHDMPA